jgi:uncharacterized protein
MLTMPLRPPSTHVLYLHGFRSSPQSTKARMVAQKMAQNHPGVTFWCPQLPPSPHEAMQMVMQGMAAWPRESMAVMGSSLGGYYATWLAEKQGCRAVVMNPAVFAARDLAKYVGEHTGWHDASEKFVFKAQYVGELEALACTGLTQPANYFALIAKGDEVLDWREMTARYPGAHIKLLPGSDHAISDFSDHMEEVLGFLGL